MAKKSAIHLAKLSSRNKVVKNSFLRILTYSAQTLHFCPIIRFFLGFICTNYNENSSHLREKNWQIVFDERINIDD
jgi:hypothetical protein